MIQTGCPSTKEQVRRSRSLLQLLLGADVVGVTALLLPAVGGTGMEPGVALAANHLIAVILLGQNTKGWFDDTTSKTENQVESGFCKTKRQFHLDFDLNFKILYQVDLRLSLWRS